MSAEPTQPPTVRPPRVAAAPAREPLSPDAREVRASLLATPPSLPSRFFYDDEGSRLFERITQLPEYYQTRTELVLLQRHAAAIVGAVRPVELAELGSGVSAKMDLLLGGMARAGHLERCSMLDVNEAVLELSAVRLRARFPGLVVRCVQGDFLRDLRRLGPGGGRLLALLGGTLGNLDPERVPAFLGAAATILAPGDGFLIGVDLVKDRARVEAAYNDAAGVTALFNLNILHAMNASMGADFDPGAFAHVAVWDAERSCIEMRLRAERACRVQLSAPGVELAFDQGDELRTEISCKYTRASLGARVHGSGLAIEDWHEDGEALFALALLRRRG